MVSPGLRQIGMKRLWGMPEAHDTLQQSRPRLGIRQVGQEEAAVFRIAEIGQSLDDSKRLKSPAAPPRAGTAPAPSPSGGTPKKRLLFAGSGRKTNPWPIPTGSSRPPLPGEGSRPRPPPAIA